MLTPAPRFPRPNSEDRTSGTEPGPRDGCTPQRAAALHLQSPELTSFPSGSRDGRKEMAWSLAQAGLDGRKVSSHDCPEASTRGATAYNSSHAVRSGLALEARDGRSEFSGFQTGKLALWEISVLHLNTSCYFYSFACITQSRPGYILCEMVRRCWAAPAYPAVGGWCRQGMNSSPAPFLCIEILTKMDLHAQICSLWLHRGLTRNRKLLNLSFSLINVFWRSPVSTCRGQMQGSNLFSSWLHSSPLCGQPCSINCPVFMGTGHCFHFFGYYKPQSKKHFGTQLFEHL